MSTPASIFIHLYFPLLCVLLLMQLGSLLVLNFTTMHREVQQQEVVIRKYSLLLLCAGVKSDKLAGCKRQLGVPLWDECLAGTGLFFLCFKFFLIKSKSFIRGGGGGGWRQEFRNI